MERLNLKISSPSPPNYWSFETLYYACAFPSFLVIRSSELLALSMDDFRRINSSPNDGGFRLRANARNDSVPLMRVEICEDSEERVPATIFLPGENYVDLREDPHAVERLEPALRYSPLRNFLTAVNSVDSIFSSISASAQSDSPETVAVGETCQFTSQASLVFAESAINFERERFMDLARGLKGLLERDTGDATRSVLWISPCEFPDQNRRGSCLIISLTAQGGSAQQAEIRWGLGLARVQQALLFTARALRQ
jgi:hypothetical protein